MAVKARARTNIFEESEFGNKFLHQDTESPDNQEFVGSTQQKDIHKTSNSNSHHQRSELTTDHQRDVTKNIRSKGQGITEILCN